MITFPLYDNLISQVEEKELTLLEREKLCVDIKKLDSKGHELMYALIKVYHMKNEENAYKLPYGMKSLKAGHRVDLNVLPFQLQQILVKFIELHNSSS